VRTSKNASGEYLLFIGVGRPMPFELVSQVRQSRPATLPSLALPWETSSCRRRSRVVCSFALRVCFQLCGSIPSLEVASCCQIDETTMRAVGRPEFKEIRLNKSGDGSQAISLHGVECQR
jgi:hypothetical protein